MWNKLNKDNTMVQVQEYIRNVIELRGVSEQNIEKTMLLLTEEVGELAKSIRKDQTSMSIDNSKINNYDTIESEVADVFIVLCSGVARNNTIEKPNYVKVMEKLPCYPGKKDNEKFEKLINNSHSITKEELNVIDVPTLVLNGGVKDLVSRDEAEYISNNIKNSELLILEKAGHCNYIFNNRDFYNKLNSFLGE